MLLLRHDLIIVIACSMASLNIRSVNYNEYRTLLLD